MRLPSLPALRVFEAAGRHMSFTKASAELNVTQAAVSHQIRALEDQLGARLFLRTTRRLSLTPAGAKLLPRIAEAFRLVEDAVADLGRAETVLTITTTPSFGAKWLAPRLGRLFERQNGLEVQVRHTMALVALAREGVDVGIRWGRGRWAGLESELIGRPALVPVASPDYMAKLKPTGRQDVARAVLLHEDSRGDWIEWLALAGLDRGLAAHGPILDDDNTLVAATLAGQGLALLPREIVVGDVIAGRLVEVFDLPTGEGYGYYLVYPPGALDIPRVRVFREFVLAEGARDLQG